MVRDRTQEGRPNPLIEMGKVVRAAREKAGMSQFCLAKALGLSSGQSISNIERGLVALPAAHVGSVSRILKVDQDVLVNLLLELQRIRLSGGTR